MLDLRWPDLMKTISSFYESHKSFSNLDLSKSTDSISLAFIRAFIDVTPSVLLYASKSSRGKQCKATSAYDSSGQEVEASQFECTYWVDPSFIFYIRRSS